MDIKIHTTTLPHDDPNALPRLLARRPRVRGPPAHLAFPDVVAKGTHGWILLATEDLDGTFERVHASGAEVAQEPMAQDYGVRDCAFRDPARNLVRIQERR